MTPREVWFKKRIDECLQNLATLHGEEDWQQFKDKAHEIACEILYATTEWDKYYKET